MFTVEYAFSSTHDMDEEFWESQAAESLDEAAEIIFRVNPENWEVINEQGQDCSLNIQRIVRQMKKGRASS